MFRNISAIILLKPAAIGAATLALLSGTSVVHAEDFPSRPITIIVPFGVGGGNDTIARAFAPYLSNELGVPVNIENRPGAGTLVGSIALLSSAHDGYTMLFSSVTPYIAQTILVRGADYSVEDFHLIDLPSRDFTLIKASPSSGISSYDEFLERLKQNPGDVTIGVTPGSADFANLILTLERHDIDVESARIVTYDGGGETRLAVMAGHVDVGLSAATATFPIKEEIVPLALFADEEVSGFEEVSLVMEIENQEVDFMPGSQRGWTVTTEFVETHPERYQILLDAIESISADEVFLEEINTQLPGYTWYGPENSNAAFMRAYNLTSQYMDKMQPQ